MLILRTGNFPFLASLRCDTLYQFNSSVNVEMFILPCFLCVCIKCPWKSIPDALSAACLLWFPAGCRSAFLFILMFTRTHRHGNPETHTPMSIFLETVFIIVGSIDFFSCLYFLWQSGFISIKTFSFEERPVLIHTLVIVPTDQLN